MMPTIIIGLIFASIVIFAFTKAKKDVKANKCAGCSGCSNKSQCSL